MGAVLGNPPLGMAVLGSPLLGRAGFETGVLGRPLGTAGFETGVLGRPPGTAAGLDRFGAGEPVDGFGREAAEMTFLPDGATGADVGVEDLGLLTADDEGSAFCGRDFADAVADDVFAVDAAAGRAFVAEEAGRAFLVEGAAGRAFWPAGAGRAFCADDDAGSAFFAFAVPAAFGFTAVLPTGVGPPDEAVAATALSP